MRSLDVRSLIFIGLIYCMKLSPEKSKSEEVRRKQIESTLNELHRLQAEIYELNIPENPHSNPPVKKEIKQLAYLYENMTSTFQDT